MLLLLFVFVLCHVAVVVDDAEDDAVDGYADDEVDGDAAAVEVAACSCSDVGDDVLPV